MTVQEIIERTNTLEPNDFEEGQKIRWLQDLDGQIYRDLVETHENPVTEEFPAGYSMETELLTPSPFGEELYVWYLIEMIYLHNAEVDGYNRAQPIVSAAYRAFADYYNRTHMPKTAGTRFRF